MDSKDIVSDEVIEYSLKQFGWTQNVDQGRLMLLELLIKASAGYRNSHTEELFLNSFYLMKKDRTPKKVGRRFICAMIYECSNRRPEAYRLMENYRV